MKISIQPFRNRPRLQKKWRGVHGASQRGFALVVTISMMVLLTLLAVGMLGLSTTVLRSSGQNAHRQKANDNARMALQLAIGELQRGMGPDRRVTASASIMSTNGIGSLDAAVEKQQYVGVFDTEASRNSMQWDDRRDTSFRKWLVSGDAEDLKQLDWAGGSDLKEAVTVLGAGSLGDGRDDLHVQVPTVGLTDENGKRSGRYAWWVSDSGMKASVALGDDDPDKLGHMVVPQFGLSRVGGMEWADSVDAAEWDKLASVNTAELMSDQAGDSLKEGYHWLTTRHNGLLTDPREGGLRKDLSVALASDRGKMENAIGERMFEPVTKAGPGGPYWEQVRQFYRAGGNSSLEVVPQTKDQMGVYPVVAGFVEMYGLANTVGYMPSAAPHPSLYPSFYNKRTDGSDVYAMTMFMTPVIKLWNPYNRSIQASDGMTVSVGNGNKQYGASADDSYEDIIWWGRNGGGVGGIDARPPKTMRYEHRYFLPPTTFAPGEVKIFTLGGNQFLDLDGTYRTQTGKPVGAKTNVAKDGWILAELQEGGFTGHAVWDTMFTKRDIPDSDRRVSKWGGGRSIGGYGGSDGGDLQVLDSNNPGGLGFTVNPHSFSTWNLKLFAGRSEKDGTGSILPLVNMRNVSTDSTGFRKANTLFTTVSNPTSTPVFSLPDFQDSIYARRAVLRMVLNEGDDDRSLYNQARHATKDVRWLATHNPRSPTFGCSPFEHKKATFTGKFTGSKSPMIVNGRSIRSRSFGLGTTPNYLSGMLPELVSQDALFLNQFIGFSDIGGPERAILFDMPQSSSPERYFMSVGQLHHANLWIEDGNYVDALLNGHGEEDWFADNLHPAYPIGNSWADPRVKLSENAGRYFEMEIQEGANTYHSVHHDLSWQLNSSLWDRFFFSAPDSSDKTRSHNPRLQVLGGDKLEDGSKGIAENAASLMVRGAFNVNCTNTEAWKAFLSSLADREVSGSATNGVPFSRFEDPYGREVDPATGVEDEEVYTGFRGLTRDEIDELSERIVEQIRERGPFHSLGEFVNRSAFEGAPKEYQLKGLLQTAIDESTINENLRGNGDYVIASNRAGSVYEKEAYAGDVAAGAPGYLTQGDVMAKLGHVMSVRSDTFVVRAYGESVDPNGKVMARAWCEATVQRMPEYVDSSLDTAMEPKEIDLSEMASRFGRRMVVTGFRWLTAEA